MTNIKGKNIVLGITGSIAAYKAAEIIRVLKDRGARVFPVMTKSARHFVHPLTFQSICQEKVLLNLFEDKDESLKHISLSRLADALVIAPATANIIGKIASGIADDILTTTVLATRAPVVIAPAMNEWMYQNPLVQANIAKLKSLGYRFIGPEEGKLACGDEGRGRMSEPGAIVDFLEDVLLCKNDLKGKSFLITAGPTREPLDRVRFISNYSSGKMGFAIAKEAKERGARVILIAGPTWIEPPPGIKLYRVETANQMLEKVREHFRQVDGLIMASAVSDFRPLFVHKGKIKKEGKEKITLEFVKNPDILEEVAKIKGDKIVVGFCAETENLLEEARKKLSCKNMNLVVANDLTEEGAGFGVDTNKVTIMDAQGKLTHLPLMSKYEVAREILNHVKILF
ncbi:bifunctional phosphopantothenoylcysteine decarboxylase/phosphopantothenate--cysteine ligase CoaBC [Candidatus Aerophobetes bacterium]|nr:bifunctional phosphopantothenoylcysteine decarboxylase/phosphopantothenate--cysteine ligase CoaBC [Candidatus Aerophobetes bacterium]